MHYFSFSPFASSACIFCATPKSVGNCKKTQRPNPRKQKKSPKKKLLRIHPRKSPFTISLKRNNGAPSRDTANQKRYTLSSRIPLVQSVPAPHLLIFGGIRNQLTRLVVKALQIAAVRPKTLQVVKQTGFVVENVYDYVTVVNDRPTPVAHTLRARGN